MPNRGHWSLRRALALACLAIAFASACAPAPDPYADNYLVKGGGTPLAVFQALSGEFARRHPGVRFDFEDTGSAPGMALVATGDIDLALSSTEPAAAIKSQVQLVPVGASGTAIVVNAANTVTSLTREQLKAIFTGQITDWSAIGGAPGRIRVATRTSGSAIQKSLDSYLFGSASVVYAREAIVLDDTTQTMNAVGSRADVISIVTATDAAASDKRIRVIALGGILPTRENLASRTYPISRPLYIVYRTAGVKPAIQAFVDFVRSADGQRIIAAANQPG